MRDERDKVGAKRGQPAKLLDGAALGLVGADVLDCAGDQSSEQADELELLGVERSRLAANERDHSERPRPLQQRRRDPAAEPELPELALLGVAHVGHVLAVDRLAGGKDLGEQGLAHRLTRAPREDRLGTDSRHRQHLCGAPLFENDRHPVERDEAAQLADEPLERLVEIERGAEGTGAACRGLEDVGTAAQLVAEQLRLDDLRLEGHRLLAQPVDQPADDHPGQG